MTRAIHPYNHRAGKPCDVHLTDQETEAHRKSLLNVTQRGSDRRETAAPAFRTQSPSNLIKPGNFLMFGSWRCFSSGSKPRGRSPVVRGPRWTVSLPRSGSRRNLRSGLCCPPALPRLSGTRTWFSEYHFLFPSSESPATFGCLPRTQCCVCSRSPVPASVFGARTPARPVWLQSTALGPLLSVGTDFRPLIPLLSHFGVWILLL